MLHKMVDVYGSSIWVTGGSGIQGHPWLLNELKEILSQKPVICFELDNNDIYRCSQNPAIGLELSKIIFKKTDRLQIRFILTFFHFTQRENILECGEITLQVGCLLPECGGPEFRSSSPM